MRARQLSCLFSDASGATPTDIVMQMGGQQKDPAQRAAGDMGRAAAGSSRNAGPTAPLAPPPSISGPTAAAAAPVNTGVPLHPRAGGVLHVAPRSDGGSAAVAAAVPSPPMQRRHNAAGSKLADSDPMHWGAYALPPSSNNGATSSGS